MAKRIKFPCAEFAERFASEYAAKVADGDSAAVAVLLPYRRMRARIINLNRTGWSWRDADYIHAGHRLTEAQVSYLLRLAKARYFDIANGVLKDSESGGEANG